jgi:hypothetical protein
MPNGDKPVTQAQLAEALSAQTDRLVETMRDMQTEILRAFEAWSAGQTIRLRKLEADHSNLDAAASGRIEVLERRLFEIEKRLHLEPPKGSADLES